MSCNVRYNQMFVIAALRVSRNWKLLLSAWVESKSCKGSKWQEKYLWRGGSRISEGTLSRKSQILLLFISYYMSLPWVVLWVLSGSTMCKEQHLFYFYNFRDYRRFHSPWSATALHQPDHISECLGVCSLNKSSPFPRRDGRAKMR